jgi:broad specificity phosphatase PhoE
MRSIERAFLIGVEGVTEVLLVRHGDCYEDLDGTLDDPRLSPTGREQARRLGERLKRLPIDAVYSSPLRRARDTALQIQADVQADPRLVEVEADSSSGMVEIREDPASAAARLGTFVDEAVARHPGGRVVVVCHGVLILNYLCEVLRLEHGTLRLMPYYTSVSVVRAKGERRMAGALADIAHLEGLPWPR